MENFAKKLAINQKVIYGMHNVPSPLKFVMEDFSVIERAYELLSESVTNEVPIPPSGEWLLDNFYIIEEQVGFLANSLGKKEYNQLPMVATSQGKVARVYSMARELVKFCDGAISKENIELFMNSYETQKALLQEELYVFPTMLQIALIEHIRIIASKIITEQLQKFKVESLVERIIKNKEVTRQRFREYKSVNLDHEASSYVEYLMYLLKKMGSSGKPYLDVLEEEIVKVGSTSSEIMKAEHYAIAVHRVSMSNAILSIKNILRLNWSSIFQEISCIEKILSQDEQYEHLDAVTKEMYRNAIKEIAKKAKVSEIYVTHEARKVAREESVDMGEILIRRQIQVVSRDDWISEEYEGESARCF